MGLSNPMRIRETESGIHFPVDGGFSALDSFWVESIVEGGGPSLVTWNRGWLAVLAELSSIPT